MRQAVETHDFRTPGRGLHEITAPIVGWARAQAMTTGLLTLFCRHTSASLVIQENAAPAARADLEAFFDRIAPEGRGLYAHNDEGPDDMPAHLRTALTATTLTIPLAAGRLTLGAWQGIYLFEHRRAPHERQVVTHLIGA